MTAKKSAASSSPDVQQRDVRLVLEGAGEHGSQWAANGSIAAKIGCTAETLRRLVQQAERDRGKQAGPTEQWERIKVLERENRELRQASEIPRKASAYLPSMIASSTITAGHTSESGRRTSTTCWS